MKKISIILGALILTTSAAIACPHEDKGTDNSTVTEKDKAKSKETDKAADKAKNEKPAEKPAAPAPKDGAKKPA